MTPQHTPISGKNKEKHKKRGKVKTKKNSEKRQIVDTVPSAKVPETIIALSIIDFSSNSYF